jgi:ABC-type multidrug transport system fused ATPase/permease subunit
MLLELRGEVTLIVIAHRLSTIQEAQRVIFIKEGAIAAEGSFAEVERIIPEFGKSNLE